jgi:WXG100 family type VII secretion target
MSTFDDSALAVSFTELRNASTELERKRSELESDLASMSSRISDMRSMWKGQAAAAFDQRWSEWSKAGNDLKMSLESISSFLKTAADSFEQADQTVRKSLG